MAMMYTGGTVVATPELTHSASGSARLVFGIREERPNNNGGVFVDEAIVEMYGEQAEQYANLVDEGAVVKLKGFPRAIGRLGADGKPIGQIIVKAREVEIVTPADNGRQYAQSATDPDDPFADD